VAADGTREVHLLAAATGSLPDALSAVIFRRVPRVLSWLSS
jgi:hypothetical protein